MNNNIYLISSNSIRLLEDEIKKIIGDNSFTTYDLNRVELDEIIEEAAYISLFNEKKYMLVKNANFFGSTKKKGQTKKMNEDNLLKYLENPNPNTILIFTINGKIDGKKKICKIIKEKYHYIEIKDLQINQIYTLANQILEQNKYKIKKEDLYYIINCCQNNYDLVYNELNKIILYYDYNNDKTILKEDIINIVSKNILDNNFKFIDLIINKNIKEAFKYYDDFIIQKAEPLIIINMVSKEIRNMLITKLLITKTSKQEIMKQLNIYYEFQIDKIISNSYNYQINQLEKLLIFICDLEYKIKSGKISSKLALVLLIMKFCI